MQRGRPRQLFVGVLANLFHQPSWLTLSWVCLVCIAGRPLSLELLAKSLLFDFLLRAAALVGVALHEASHLMAAWMVFATQTGAGRRLLDEHRVILPSLPDALLPLARLPSSYAALGPCAAQSLQDASPTAGAFVKVFGLSVSVMLPWLALALTWEAVLSLEVASWATLMGTSVPALGAVLSDLPWGPLLGSQPPAGCFCCGNWGLLMPREALDVKLGKVRGGRSKLVPGAVESILTSVLDIVELRGAQAGGCVTFLGARGDQVEVVRSRTVKSKRGHLASQLFRGFNRELWWRSAARWLRCDRLQPLPAILAQGHSRFGTSSVAAVVETHPHQWLGPHVEWVWQPDMLGIWRRRRVTVCTTITHNGDFDGSVLYGRTTPNGLLGEWLARVLHCRHAAAGDSPKLAGMMDLLLCQGMWFASVRYAFAFWVLRHLDEAFSWELAGRDAPSAVPPKSILAEWAGAFEQEFGKVTIGTSYKPTADGMHALAEAAAASLDRNLCRMSAAAAQALQRWGLANAMLRSFCQKVVESFFQQDLLSSVSSFFSHAVGTFGISVSCTLWPSSIVLAAKGQPVSLAFDAESSLALWSSEPTALNVSCPGTGGSTRVAASRWDLDDARGEAVELRVLDGSIQPEDALSCLPGGLQSATFFSLPGGRNKGSAQQIVLRGISLEAEPTALSSQSFLRRWVRLRSPPPGIVPRGTADPIASDLQDVPAVIEELEDSWADPTALNHISGQNFASCLRELLGKAPKEEAAGAEERFSIDVLVFGIESSLWLGQQFAADLKRVFPRLNITAMSSNWVLGLLQDGHGRIEPLNFALSRQTFRLSPGAICLAVSQSGTTYPTVWSARLLRGLPQRPRIFAMAAGFESVLANSIGQDMTEPVFSGCLFSTMAGVRPAEPSTVATLAMHHSLTMLLLASTEHVAVFAKEAGLAPVPFASEASAAPLPLCQLRTSDLSDFKRLAHSFLPAAESLCGVSRRGQPLQPSESREELLKVGRYLASHLLELWYSTVLAALYIYITVTLGLPLCSGLWHVAISVTDGGDLGLGSRGHEYISYAINLIDAHCYVFLAAMAATLHRLLTRRRLFTRYTNRSIVLVDSTMNYKLLRAYLSKLGALAFRFTAFGVAGQNGLDHFVHEMTHRTTSEVILLVGRPDGRLGTLAAAERAIILASQQARYVASRSTSGIEMVSLGHNPWRKLHLFAKDVVLPTTFRPKFLSSTLLQSGEGPHDPLDVCQRAGNLAGGAPAEAEDQEAAPFHWVKRQEVQELLGSRVGAAAAAAAAASREEARKILVTLVERHAERLRVDPGDFETEKVLPRSPTPPPLDEEQQPSAGAAGPRQPGRLARTVSLAEATFAPLKNQSGSEIGGGARFSAHDIIALLRGRPMENHINELRDSQVRQMIRQLTEKRVVARVAQGHLRAVFAEWCAAAKRCKSERQRGRRERRLQGLPEGITRMQSVPSTAEWRVQEEYRRRRRQRLHSFQASKFSTEACFLAWKARAAPKGFRRQDTVHRTLSLAISRASQSPTALPTFACNARSPASQSPTLAFTPMNSRAPAPCSEPLDLEAQVEGSGGLRLPAASALAAASTSSSGPAESEDALAGADPVGSWLLSQAKGKELLAQLSLMESLYETRVASAERLLASFIILHRAVQPLSRLWGLSFDMDRSESRLRVASTPSPVAYVEDAEPAAAAAAPPDSGAGSRQTSSRSV